MKLYGQTGIPVRSKVQVKDTTLVKEQFRNRQGIIVYGLADYAEHDYGYGYFVQLEGMDRVVFLEEYMIDFVSYPVPLQNWLRNKIKLLYEIDPQIARELAEEKAVGNFPYGDKK